MALTLYSDSFSISPYAFAVYVALEEKGVPYRVQKVSLADKQHERAEYRAGSITGRIPAIDHDGFWLAESAAIVDYLDEVFTAPQYKLALPTTPKERARARMVMQCATDAPCSPRFSLSAAMRHPPPHKGCAKQVSQPSILSEVRCK